MKSVAVYLGSATGNDPKFISLAKEFARKMAGNGISIVYGGASVGMMGALAEEAIASGGEIIGVFPKGFRGKREVAEKHIPLIQDRITRMVEVKDFGERKQVMEDLSDCAVALPGGAGTMDEIFCYIVGNEIGRHDKKAYFLNLDGYYDGIRMLIDSMTSNALLARADEMIVFCDSVDDFLERIKSSE